MNNTVAVVVTYNRIDLLKECIDHLHAQTAPVDIMVIDNASTDGTGNLFESDFKDVIYFNTGANLGGAGGFNYGMRKACELGYEFIWVMDDDTLPEPTALEKLLEVDQKLDGNYGWLSSFVMWKDESPCVMNIQKKTKWKPLKNFDKQERIQYASFVSLFLKSDIIQAFGLPYKEFFIWGDDWEYTRRISKSFLCFFVPDSLVYHWCKENKGADIATADNDSLERYEYLYRNDVVIYRQDGIDGLVYMILRITKHMVKILLMSDNRLKKIKLVFRSIIKGIEFKPKNERR